MSNGENDVFHLKTIEFRAETRCFLRNPVFFTLKTSFFHTLKPSVFSLAGGKNASWFIACKKNSFKTGGKIVDSKKRVFPVETWGFRVKNTS